MDTPLDDLLKYLGDKEGVNVLNVKDDLLAKKEVAGEYLYYPLLGYLEEVYKVCD